MLDRSLVFIDLETTGAAAGSDRITQISVIEVERGEYVREWSTLVIRKWISRRSSRP